MSEARQIYAERVARFEAQLEALDRAGERLANARTATFLAALAIALLVIFERLPRAGWLGAVALLVGYLALVIRHGAVIREEGRSRVLLTLNQRGLLRLDGAWRKFASTGEGLLPEGHLYGADLDVVGQGSLFQRLDETGTRAGQAQLAAWLGAPSSAEDARARQGALAELAPLLDFRQALVTEARAAGEGRVDPSRFIAWVEGPATLEPIRWARALARALPAITVTLGLLAVAGVLVALPFWIAVLVQGAVVAATRKRLRAMYEALVLSERGLVRFEETFEAIDAQAFTHPLLQELQAGLQREGPRVSHRLRRFARLLTLAELRQSELMHPVVNLLLLWDVQVLFRVEGWRTTMGAGVRRWFEALAQLEALSSFAGLVLECPQFAWPQVSEGDARFVAQGLGHPLLDAPVLNDVALDGPGRALVITGSNMSGKTTLMRAMGLNAVMAFAGLPVRAQALALSRVQVMTSMRLKDSLERGVSYFYAEVQRIKTLLDTAQAHPRRCLFFLDELFMGTNTRERQVASRQLLLHLLDAGANGAVTTHDLALCEVEKERPDAVRNVHFRDEIKAGEMTFDYRLREGVVQGSNALEVLRRAGVPV